MNRRPVPEEDALDRAEDPDGNGVGIRLVDEAIDETGYQDIAF